LVDGCIEPHPLSWIRGLGLALRGEGPGEGSGHGTA
jgi:hypothetical protein